jgi:hypothetical protein
VAEKRGKFAALADLNRADQETIEPDLPIVRQAEVPAVVETETGKGRGRPATGKRSNPDWKLYSHYLKRKTQRAAVAKLQAEDGEHDLSDVLEELLQNWLKS